jgi:selenocysteine lyase/cysteine desulfurase
MDVEALRAIIPGTAHRVHLNNAGAALLSQPTLDAMTDHLRLEAEIGGYEAEAAAQEAIDATYEAVAELVGGASSEVALSTTPLRRGTRRSTRSRSRPAIES